jgi:hypothetical protein
VIVPTSLAAMVKHAASLFRNVETYTRYVCIGAILRRPRVRLKLGTERVVCHALPRQPWGRVSDLYRIPGLVLDELYICMIDERSMPLNTVWNSHIHDMRSAYTRELDFNLKFQF